MSAASSIVAVCGKGGVGKTAVTALLAKALLDQGVAPILLIDADPVGGLRLALGETDGRCLADVRARVIDAARTGGRDDRDAVAGQLDVMVADALIERSGYALLAMGHSTSPGCFCAVNKLLRDSLDVLTGAFAMTLIDAEAGIEQINREVTRRTTGFVVVTDGSGRSLHTLHVIREMVAAGQVGVVLNRSRSGDERGAEIAGAPVLAVMPEDESLRQIDARGEALWSLPANAPSRMAAARLAEVILARWTQPNGGHHG